ASDWLQLETGVRGDYVIDYGWVFLPRIAALFRISPALSSRVGGGLGYKVPNIFTEETERIQFRSVVPLGAAADKLERSYGLNFYLNYRATLFEKLSLSVNQLFFYTRINHPLLLEQAAGNRYQLANAGGYLDTRGWETNVKLSYQDFKLFVGYTFTDAHLKQGGIAQQNPLTARHRLNNVLMYEIEEKWRAGLE